MNWGANQSNQIEGVIASSIGGTAAASYSSKVNGGKGGSGGSATATVSLGGDVSVGTTNLAMNCAGCLPFQDAPSYNGKYLVGGGVIASSWGMAGAAGYDSSHGGDGGGGGNATIVITDAGVITSAPTPSNGTGIAGSIPAVLAQSIGAAAGNGGSVQNDSGGGGGGNANEVSVSIQTTTGTRRTISTNGELSGAVVAVSSAGVGGNGTNYNNFTLATAAGGDGGTGGTAHGVTVNLGSNIDVRTAMVYSPGIQAVSVGANGGNGGSGQGASNGRGGNGNIGGAGGAVAVSVGNFSTVATASDNSIAIAATSAGGNGGFGGYAGVPVQAVGGNGGNGAAGGNVAVNLGVATVSTQGANSAAILAQSLSGSGGAGGKADAVAPIAGSPGNSGNTGTITVSNASGTITTAGTGSPGVLAQGMTGVGGSGATASGIFLGFGSDGGSAGSIGLVSVSSVGLIATTGNGSNAITAQSLAGGGGSGGGATGLFSLGGDSGQGGAGGSVVVSTAGTITTAGLNSDAVLAQSIGGGGGVAGYGSGLTAVGGSGAAGGNGGAITVDNNGGISTGGQQAHGLVGQSIGGGGGAGGNAVNGLNVGGSGGATGQGGGVDLSNTGSITTSGSQSLGLLAQSIGGGGGVGGDAQGVITIGGSASGGGSGGSAGVTLTRATTTFGDLSDGAVAQSIGGGGGLGGNATSISAIAGLSIGGHGGAGGTGGAATITANAGSTVQTSGSSAYGLVAQSIGGGGGVAGAAYNITGSVGVGASVSLGGTGGTGGNGGAATATLVGANVTTGLSVLNATDPASLPDGTATAPLAVNSYGVVAQSTGGGGGMGGAATAKAVVLDLPVPVTEKPTSIAISAAFAAGGDGGVAGKGGAATVNLSNGSNVLTYGNGAHGVFAQSIGGGGGTGGDSSALAASFGFKNISKFAVVPSDPLGGLAPRSNYNVDLSVANGSTGGAGGDGGPVSITVGGLNGTADANSAKPVVVRTEGDAAYGVYGQSIGGGGGDAGLGSGSTQNGTSSATALKLGLFVGSNGGSGGLGGAVTITEFAGSTVLTDGDSAHAIKAQSVGGGGGTSSATSFQLGIPSIANLNNILSLKNLGYTPGNLAFLFGGLASSVTIKLGADGVSGANGGAANVAVYGAVKTTGQASDGVFVQSVGGGGGEGGSAGSGGSSDDPTILNLDTNSTLQSVEGAKKFANGLAGYAIDVFNSILADGNFGAGVITNLKDFFPSLNLRVSLGGDGGTGGTGGAAVATVNGGTVVTLGDYSNGVFAQSVGGGGGKGGGAVAGGSSGFGSLMAINFNVALGATGGGGGAGGTVTVNLGGQATIATSGYAAYGVLGQSVGGGGGIVGSAETNSSGYLALGMISNGATSSGGAGGSVTLAQVGSGPATVTTAGAGSHAILLQSVGGGGGIGGQGFGASASVSQLKQLGTSGNDPAAENFTVGGVGAYGNGGAITLDATNKPNLVVRTSGPSAFGLLAQSVGGGGGLAFQEPGAAGTYTIGGAGPTSTGTLVNGGKINLNFADGSSITTTGDDSIGIVAQSIGGGGGISGYAAGPALILPTTGANRTVSGSSGVTAGASDGDGDGVFITTGNLTIQTSGASAHGILAQSVGAGGGIAASSDGTALYVGSVAGSESGLKGAGSLVQIVQAGLINVTGTNSIGIYAQSTGARGGGGVALTVNGSVAGGSGTQGAGLRVDSNGTTNSVLIGSTGSVSARSGMAITVSGSGKTNVINNGVVYGAYNLASSGATGTFTNNGTIIPQGNLAGNTVNAGLIAPSLANGFAPITHLGNFQQTAGGIFAPNVDFGGRQADRLVVAGTAQLDGLLRPVPVSVLPRVNVSVLTVGGNATGQMSAAPSTLFTYTVTPVASATATTYLLSNQSANFAPASAGLTVLQQGVAGHLQSIYDAGGSLSYGRLFASLGAIADASPSAYAGTIGQLAPQGTADFGARALANLSAFAADLGGCQGAGGATVVGQDGRCVWLRAGGVATSQSSGLGAAGFQLNSFGTALGGEAQIAPNWTLDGAIAYDSNWLKSTGGAQKGNGTNVYGGIGLRHDIDAWTLSAAAFGSVGSVSTTRIVSISGLQPVVKGKGDLGTAGGRIGLGYQLGTEALWMRPQLTLDGIYVTMPGYRETGGSLPALAFRTSDQATFVATPSVEFGKVIDLSTGSSLRLTVTPGLSLLSNNSWSAISRFADAPPGASSFKTTVPMDNVVGRLGIGAQLLTANGFELRADYIGAFSQHVTSHGGALNVSMKL